MAIRADVFIVLGGIQVLATTLIMLFAARYKDSPCPGHLPQPPMARQSHGRVPRGVTNLAKPAAHNHRSPSPHSPPPGGLSKNQAGCLLAALADGCRCVSSAVPARRLARLLFRRAPA